MTRCTTLATWNDVLLQCKHRSPHALLSWLFPDYRTCWQTQTQTPDWDWNLVRILLSWWRPDHCDIRQNRSPSRLACEPRFLRTRHQRENHGWKVMGGEHSARVWLLLGCLFARLVLSASTMQTSRKASCIMLSTLRFRVSPTCPFCELLWVFFFLNFWPVDVISCMGNTQYSLTSAPEYLHERVIFPKTPGFTRSVDAVIVRRKEKIIKVICTILHRSCCISEAHLLLNQH